jgi:cation diffusion facilitator family transporter
LGNSQALIADAVHSISDFFSDAVVLWGLKVGRRGADDDHHFGHARFETVASALVGVALVAVAVGIGQDAAKNIYFHEENHPGWVAVLAAAFSIVSKEWLFRYTLVVGRRIKSMAVVANAWHHRTDALSSVAVLAGVLAARLHPELHILDAVAALLVSVFVLKAGVDILWAAMKEMTDAAPSAEVLDSMRSCVECVHGVRGHHDLKVRSSGGLLMVQIHVQVDGRLSVVEGHRIAKEVEDCLLRDVEDVVDVMVHIDPSPADAGSTPPG